MKRLAVVFAVFVLAGSACAQADDPTVGGPDPTPAAVEGEVSLAVTAAPSEIDGNVLEIPVELEGFTIVGADGDTSGTTGHFHVFIDRDPLAVGETIPKEAGIVHSTENPIKIYGLSVGEHTVTVVLGDGTHTRVVEDAAATFTVDVKGPSVQATAPATVAAGEDVTVEITSEGVEIVAADGDTSGATGHYHVLIDPETPPQAGATIPAAEEGKIVHTTEGSVTLSGLESGEHTIWVVLGDGVHAAFDPAVMAKLTVTVQG